jgi:DNA-directed RNA polymerase sigma subunit (sigma70/sigma32)
MSSAYVDTTSFVDDPVQVYLREVCAAPPLTKDEEVELSQHVLANDQQAEFARKRLIEASLAMVVSVAERYCHEGIHLLDLVQKGNDGLLLALEKFANDPNTSFPVHAAACVNAAIARAIAESPTHE